MSKNTRPSSALRSKKWNWQLTAASRSIRRPDRVSIALTHPAATHFD
jgi:hypothetical protein